MKIIWDRIDTNFQGDFGYSQARAGYKPDGFAILTSQPERISGSDIYYGIEMKKSYDGGKTWSDFQPCLNLNRQPWGDAPGVEQVFL